MGYCLLLLVESQIGNLITGLFFYNNICFKWPNGSYEPILDIHVPKAFQWYKELFNPMNCDPCNCPLKIRTPTPTWESGVHSLTLLKFL